jgi:hypothetical protein
MEHSAVHGQLVSAKSNGTSTLQVPTAQKAANGSSTNTTTGNVKFASQTEKKQSPATKLAPNFVTVLTGLTKNDNYVQWKAALALDAK